jgi:DNA-binding NarL/FixJ family response regulator
MQHVPPQGYASQGGAAPAQAPKVLAQAAEVDAAPQRRLRVYIIEDNAIICESLVATLEELAPVEVVGTAAEEWTAVQWLSQAANGCDLAIVDIFLRSGSGLGVLRSLDSARPGYPIVVLSNYATADIRRKCLELGADAVFDKSNDIDALLAYCRRLAGAAAGS